MKNVGVRLSTLWIFAVVNYLYCDIVGLMDSRLLSQYLAGSVDGMDIGPGFLMGAAVLMEIPIVMIVLCRLLPRRPNRWANIAAGGLMTLVQAATLLVGTPTGYYMFFSAVEIACTAFIVWYAVKWPAPVGQAGIAGSPVAQHA